MAFMDEMSKIKDKVLPYLQGKIIDIGCASSKITADAIGVDGRKLAGVDIVTDNVTALSNIIPIGSADCVFSAHLLEHLWDDTATLFDWWKLLRDGGYLILYLPDGRKYDHNQNMEHIRPYNYTDFMFYFKRAFCGEGKDFNGNNFKQYFHLIESGTDFGFDRYSFYLVCQKVVEK